MKVDEVKDKYVQSGIKSVHELQSVIAVTKVFLKILERTEYEFGQAVENIANIVTIMKHEQTEGDEKDE